MYTKVGIIGVSHVGAHVANSLLFMGAVDELVLSDENEILCKAQVNDLKDAISFYPKNCKISGVNADYEKLADCDIIVNAAGHVAEAAKNRDGELFVTTAEVKKFAKRIVDAGFKGVWVTVSNPNDVIATMIWKLTGYDPKKIVGAGTTLDSARLKHALSNVTGFDQHSINAWMLGEHGFSEFACWSHVNFGCQTIAEVEEQLHIKLDLADLEEQAVKGGYVSYAGKQCTEYAIANSTAKLVQAIANDAKLITPVSTLIEDVYGVSNLFASLPVVLGKAGVEQVLVPELPEAEIARWKATCEHIQHNIDQIKCW